MSTTSVSPVKPSLCKELKPSKSTLVGGAVGLLVLGGLLGLIMWMVLRGKKKAAESRKSCTISAECLPGSCYHMTDTHQEGQCYGVSEKPAVGVRLQTHIACVFFAHRCMN